MQEYFVDVKQTKQSEVSISLLQADAILKSEMELFAGFLNLRKFKMPSSSLGYFI